MSSKPALPENSSFASLVLEWAATNLSDFPWRASRSAYHVLVAELLLKRTTATAAARHYRDFLSRFPTLDSIAAASEGEVVQAFAVVGLQRQRARAMKRLAGWLLSRYGGSIPGDLGSLIEVPGLGNYSAAAILSFGHGVPIAIVDANVERILLRVFGSSLPPHPSQALLNEVAQRLLPGDEHQNYNYGLLDLGRLVCRYVAPRCGECPLNLICDYARVGADAREGTQHGMTTHARKLRMIRRERGLSQKRLAEMARMSKRTVGHIESGRTSPRRETLEKLAWVLQVRPKDL